MHKDFTIDLTQTQVDYLNTLLPKSNSVQIFQKAERRRKAQKKLDDMYVAQFSLRPVKKIKKENQHNQSKLQKHSLPFNQSQLPDLLPNPNGENNNPLLIKQNEKEGKYTKEGKEKVDKNEMQAQKEQQIYQPHTSRSQRVSRPTVAYLQFQQETFKRKVVERVKQRVVAKSIQNSVEHEQKQKPQGLRVKQQREVIRKDKVERMELQKQPSQQKQKQLINHQPQLRIIQGAKQSNTQKASPEQKQKQVPIITQKPQDLKLDYTPHPPIKQTSHNERNQPSINNNFQDDNKPQKSQNQQNSPKDMPRVKLTPKQPIEKDKNIHSLSQSKPANDIHKLEGETIVQKICWRILGKLKAHKSSWPFRHPVDPQTQGVPDYFQKIKNPMDLKTIEKKLRAQKYKSEQDFYTDVNLMLQNSFQYNPSTTKYYKLTIELEDYFKQLKSKSYLPKSSGKNSPENEKQSDYENQEENEENSKKEFQKYVRDKLETEQKFSRQDNRKRTVAQFQSTSSTPIVNRKIAKVFITTEGPMRKDKKSQNQNQVNKSNVKTETQQKVNQQMKQNKNESTKKSAQVKEIQQKGGQKSGKKQIKQIKIESGKKESKIEEQNGNQMDVQKQKLKESRFGYPEDNISLMQRQTLLYDILHIESVQIRNEIELFLQQNNEIFNRFKHGKNQKNSCQNGQGPGQKNNDQIQEQESNGSYELELKDLDQESYKMLRGEVDRLMRVQEESRKTLIGGIHGEEQKRRVKE